MVSAWLAPSSALMAGRIGSTRPIPMKAITQANATAQTALGCRSRLVLGSGLAAASASIGDTFSLPV
jgi:hypothetical protein